MELQFLGTGAGSPAKQRNVSAIALKLKTSLNEVWLFDCGEATQHQILHTSIRPSKIRRIFISHLHGDHIFGLPGLLSSRAFLGGENEPVTLYGPTGLQEYVESSLRLSQSQLTYALNFVEINQGVILDNDTIKVSTAPLSHTIPCYGFRIEEKPKAGALQVDKLHQLGIKSGPILGKLKQGLTVQLDDGRLIHGADFISPPQAGRIVTICGDSRPCDNTRCLAQNADVFVHEATFSSQEQEIAVRVGHSTFAQAAQLAYQAKVQQLYLTHISARYKEEDSVRLLQEAQAIFPATQIVQDFDVFPITKF